MFDLLILTPKEKIFDEAVESVWVDGDKSEYELLSFHAHLLSIVKSRLIVNKKIVIPVKKGIIRFFENKCVVLVEQE